MIDKDKIQLKDFIHSLLLVCILKASPLYALNTKFLQTDIQNILLHNNHLYVGATDNLYKLDENLAIVNQISTGPKQDNPLCLYDVDNKVSFCPNFAKKVSTPNYNKVLQYIEYPEKALLACGVVYEGVCYVYDIDNLTKMDKYVALNRVASNLNDASTVSYVKNDLLIVARTMTMYRSDFTLPRYFEVISARALKVNEANTMLVISTDDRGLNMAISYSESEVKVVNGAGIPAYEINYIKIFNYGAITYLLTSQPKSIDSQQLVSKIVRINFNSLDNFYIEKEISCEKDGEIYNTLVSATTITLTVETSKFVTGSSNGDQILIALFSTSSKKYAVCLVNIPSVDKDLESEFTPKPASNVFWIALDTKRVYLSSTNNINIQASLTINKPNLGNIFVHSHDRGVALFIASDSSLLEYSLTKSEIYNYGTIDLPNQQGHTYSGITPDTSGDNVYLTSGKLIVKAFLKDCSKRTTCLDCLHGVSCGWCTLDNKCSLKSECSNADKLNYFIEESYEKCPKIASITPQVTSMTTPQKIELTTLNLPSMTDFNQYQCTVHGISRPATRNGDVFECAETSFSAFQFEKVNGAGEIVVSLVTADTKNYPIASTTITVYDCTSFDKCGSCVSGKYQCGWCSKCVDQQSSCEVTENWISYQGESSSVPASCPVITGSSETLIPVEETKSIVLKGNNLPSADNTQYYCIYNYDGGQTRKVGATRKSDSELVCQGTQFNYNSNNEETSNVTVEVQYMNTFIDVNANVQLTLYKCHVNRQDCSLCLTNAPQEWNCGWCPDSGMCTIKKDSCPQWTDQDCPKPKILRFTPSSAAIGSSTTLVIEGTDLGTTAKQVMVSIAGYPCIINETQYEISRKIVCSMTSVPSPISARINVTVVKATKIQTGISLLDFHFRQPTISSIYPTVGPCSGGTIIKINGTYLDVGNSIDVTVGDKTCFLLDGMLSSDHVVCKTRGVLCSVANSRRKRRSLGNKKIQVDFDGHTVNGGVFKYDLDPTVTDVFTNKEMVRIRTFASGGQVVKVEGQRLFIIQEPKMIFNISNGKIVKISSCEHTKTNALVCLAPNVSTAMQDKKEISVMLGFDMDAVGNVRSFKNITVVQDPVIDAFEDNLLVVKTQDLILTGTGLNVLNKKDVIVTVGEKNCEVKDLDEVIRLYEAFHRKKVVEIRVGYHLGGETFQSVTVQWVLSKDGNVNVQRLVCTLPFEGELPPHPNHKVQVVIGHGGLTYNPGSIEFYKTSKEDSLPLIIGVAVGAALLLLIILLIGYFLYRRYHKKNKKYKEHVHLQMDRMESQYARECKEAFAEFQTETTDLTQDVEQNEPQYHNFRAYAMRVLYPGVTTHPILEVDRDERKEWKTAMVRLVDLLKKEDFLLTFIRTLEEQSTFQMTDSQRIKSIIDKLEKGYNVTFSKKKELHKTLTSKIRCIIASLLMVSLQSDIKYITNILKALLQDLIQKSGKRPKLLLRRTESVAEKLLTNWLAYVLHDFLERRVGTPLFKLFTAINILLEKEPIDFITCDAKNSLSEDKLLRQKIDFVPMTVNVAYVDDIEGGLYERIPVLSIDTISQTKKKLLKCIYKNQPYKKWPNIDDLLLGFVSANGAILILQDEDSTNVIDGEWKRINTLDHYKVPDNASLRLADRTSMFEGAETDGPGFLNVEPLTSSPRVITKTSSRRRILSRSSRSMQELDKSDPVSLNDTSAPLINALNQSTPMLNQDAANELKLWHMVKQTDFPQEQKEDIRQSKMMAEVYLTRLLKTKETLQSFVNELFDAVFGIHEGGREIPPSVKFLFDFLDSEAHALDILDTEVYHTWKNNSLPLRFWINMIKNPEFVFDIQKSNTVDSCLSVIAQLFMDSCSPDDHRLGKDSPSNKLLYAKEIPEYKKKVKKFYIDVKHTNFDSEAFDDSLDQISKNHQDTFNSYNAANELMAYAVKYKVKVMENLEDRGFDEYAEQLQEIMESIPD